MVDLSFLGFLEEGSRIVVQIRQKLVGSVATEAVDGQPPEVLDPSRDRPELPVLEGFDICP